MRKENDAIKKRLTAQIQDLRRQVVTKQAFDKGELMQEISRTKKELAFAHKTIHNKRAQADANSNIQNTYPDEIQNSMKLVETIGIQKKVLEDENDELKSRISELVNERSGYGSTQPMIDHNIGNPQSRQVPPLHFGNGHGGGY